MEYCCVNKNDEHNPRKNHEVHTVEHAKKLGIKDYKSLGICYSCYEALALAKQIYGDADGCAICCPLCHKE